MMRVFRACPAPNSWLLGGSPGWIPGLLEIPESAVNGKKNPIQPFFANIRLENMR
jgi:hypothetical protein